MKTIILSTKCTLFGTFTLALLGMQIPTHAATDTARVVKCAQNDIVPVKAKLRFSTLIILPEKEEILDFTTGDKNFWIINSARNLCYIHPAPVGIRSNLNLITASGHVYSFTEISNDPNAEPDLKIFIEPKEQSGIGGSAFAQGQPMLPNWPNDGSSHKSLGPSQNAAARLGSRSPRFWVPKENWAEKEKFACPSYMLSGIARAVVRLPTFAPLEHVWVSLATPGTEACDAVGGAFGPQWRERPTRKLALTRIE